MQRNVGSEIGFQYPICKIDLRELSSHTMSKKRVSYFYDSTSCATAARTAGSASPSMGYPQTHIVRCFTVPTVTLSVGGPPRASLTMSSLPPFLSPFHPVRLPSPRHLYLESPPVSTRPPVVPAPLPNRRDWQLPLWAWTSDEGASRITACPRRLPCTTSSHPHTRASSNATYVLLCVASGCPSMHRVIASRCAIGVLFVHGPLPFAPQVG